MPSNKKKQSSGGGKQPKESQEKQTTGSDVAVVSEWTKRLRRATSPKKATRRIRQSKREDGENRGSLG